MANFAGRFISNTTRIILSWIIAPIVLAFFLLGLAVAAMIICLNCLLYLQPFLALLAIIALGSSLVALGKTIIEDGAPPTRWP